VVYESTPKKKSYMRAYMVNHRKQEKNKRLANLRLQKLKVIEDLLLNYYVWIGPKQEFLNVQPNTNYIPTYKRETYAKLPVTLKTNSKTIKEVVKFTTVNPESIGHVKVTEIVPSNLQSIVTRIGNALKEYSVNMDPLYIKRQIETKLEESLTELLGQKYFFEMMLHFKMYRTTNNKAYREHYQTMNQYMKETEEALENFTIKRFMEYKTNHEVLKAAQKDNTISCFFGCHSQGIKHAEQIIETIRKELGHLFVKKKETFD
jgi:hypothetical protein